jgi:beta-galactosidase/beta-glucuronidase
MRVEPDKKANRKMGMSFVLILSVLLTGSHGKKAGEMPEMEWKPVEGRIMTQWASEVTPDSAHPEYPRPQMKREEWVSLNGLWEYAIRPEGERTSEQYDGSILVPFPVESALSGVQKPVGKENSLWYRKTFKVPKAWSEKHVQLHFEAVDWETTLWVNGREIGTHRGGYDPFLFDITDALKKRGDQKIILRVWDPIDEGTQPRGKQVREPHGIWYTSVTGIWQSVWMEPVSETCIQSLKITADIDAEEVRITIHGPETALGYRVEMEIGEDGAEKTRAEGLAGKEIAVSIEDPRLWSPDSPFLYDLTVVLKDGQGQEVDRISSYFGMRKVALGEDEAGIKRIFLNNKSSFMLGPLDQGWWPDGLYTAPTDEALRYDLEVTKKLGMNMLRKHVKVEPRRFYYWCDKLGVLVWQDMPSGDAYIGNHDEDIRRSPESARQFELELERMIQTLINHPSIVMWVPFNEGWGQYDTARIADWIKQLDPTRLADNASGWVDRGAGDVHDIHAYPGPEAPANEPDRAAVLGEFGGLGLPIKAHTWQGEKNWGYRSFESAEDLTNAYVELIGKLKGLIKNGLSAAVYTQTTDVEIEVNGLMTYDRAIIKMDAEKVAAINRILYVK